LNFGELQGFTWAERGGSHSSITSKPEMRLHNGESYQDLQTRMEKAIEEIVWNNRGKRIIIASHGGSIRTYICATLGLTMRNMSRIVISNTSITKIKLHSCDVVANNSKKLKILKREVACINWVPHDEE
jgi:broad specificity phosphatase PhoE